MIGFLKLTFRRRLPLEEVSKILSDTDIIPDKLTVCCEEHSTLERGSWVKTESTVVGIYGEVIQPQLGCILNYLSDFYPGTQLFSLSTLECPIDFLPVTITVNNSSEET